MLPLPANAAAAALSSNLMKKLFATFTVIAMLAFGGVAVAQDAPEAPAAEAAVEQVDETAAAPVEEVAAPAEEATGLVALHKTLKTKFIEGGAGFMALTLVTLVFGLALCIERIIYLSLSKTNTKGCSTFLRLSVTVLKRSSISPL